jgi:predicted acetyltransferase
VSGAGMALEPVARREAGVLANLVELYLHDMSEAFPLELGADGRFGYERLPAYFAEPERRFPFWIRSGAALAGFALAMRGSPATDDPTHLDVAEFFVLRRYRRAGVGRLAAFALFDRLRGHWVVRVSAGNPRGSAFWPTVVAEYTGGAFASRERAGDPHPQRVFELESRPGAARAP